MADLEKVIRGLRCCRNIHIGATLDDSCNQCPYQKEKGRTCVADELFHDAIAMLKAQKPCVDAAPVVHGRWRDTGSGQECSVCNEIQYGYDSGRFYCANCGAKMGEGENDD